MEPSSPVPPIPSPYRHPSLLATISLPFSFLVLGLTVASAAPFVYAQSPHHKPNNTKKSDDVEPSTLYTIPLSHYGLLARWLLRLSKTPFTERTLAPVIHSLYTLRNTKGRIRTIPQLVLPSGEVLPDSTSIMKLVEQNPSMGWLFPNEEARELYEDLGGESSQFGPALRAFLYMHFMGNTGGCDILVHTLGNWRYLPRWQAVAVRLAFPALRAVMINVMDLSSPATFHTSHAVITTTVAKLNAILADRPYLAGDSLSAPDLTLAAMCYPFVFPDEMADIFDIKCRPAVDDKRIPAILREEVLWFRETRTGKHVTKIIQEAGRDMLVPW
ncbi:hypothetical protein HDV00_007802 [Rhizophlyctis rosea]|nr:hypothetical protein HDV00_007802 [Rhizophlyctis rosea]